MPNETNTVGATMELGRLRIENESLRTQNAELVAMVRDLYTYAQLYHGQCADGVLGKDVAETRMERARAILATVQA